MAAPAAESPTKTSAPRSASVSVRIGVSRAKRPLYGSRSSRAEWTTPAMSHIVMFVLRTPSETYSSAVATAEAPAPEKTTRISSMCYSEINRALSSAAPEITAVPC